MQDNRLANFIDLAIRRETEAHDFYVELATKIADAAAKEALAHLASEEKKHRAFLEEYRAGKLQMGALKLTDVIDYKVAEHLEKPDLQKNLESKDVYLVAAHREQYSYMFYSELAALHPDGEIKNVLLRMAAEEKLHKEKVEYLYTNTAFPQTSGG